MRKEPVSFRTEAMQRFQFLVDVFRLDGPEYSEMLLPTVLYTGSGLWIFIHLHRNVRDVTGKRISVSVTIDTERGKASAELADLVEAALFAPRHRVAWRAHTAAAMRDTLDDNAVWLRRLLPTLRRPDALGTIHNANRHETDRAGNPKRRQPNIKWKYG